jgi:hypothetical protein
MAKGAIPRAYRGIESFYKDLWGEGTHIGGAAERFGYGLGEGAVRGGEEVGGAVKDVLGSGSVSGPVMDVVKALYSPDVVSPKAKLGKGAEAYEKKMGGEEKALEQYRKDQAAEQAKTVAGPAGAPDTSGVSGYGAKGLQGLMGEMQKTLPPPPSTPAQDISSLMAPYVSELTSLSGDYGAEMKYLAPYITPQTDFAGLTAAANAESGGGVPGFNPNAPGQAQQTQALQNVVTIVEGQQPGFSREDQPILDYVNSLTSQAGIQAALGYQKYLQTYGGQAPSTAGWSPQAQAAMSAIGTGGSSNLPSIANVNAANNAQKVMTTGIGGTGGTGTYG